MSQLNHSSSTLPIIDVRALGTGCGEEAVAAQLGHACRTHGFFYVKEHGIDESLIEALEQASRRFFALPAASKLAIHISRGGAARRGYAMVGEEHTSTSKEPNVKEGLCFGPEQSDVLPPLEAGRPLPGRNLFPVEVPELRELVFAYLEAMTALGHRVMRGIALSLGLPADYFATRYMTNPERIIRIFNYPASSPPVGERGWGVFAHTDWGFLTILRQDEVGGLEVLSGAHWLAAPPIPGTFVCNIGDMLGAMTGNLYRSTLHRVRNRPDRARLSIPFFFDPSWDAALGPIEVHAAAADLAYDVSGFRFPKTFGDYIVQKLGLILPDVKERAS